MTESAERLVAEAIEVPTTEPKPTTGTDMQKAPKRRTKKKTAKKNRPISMPPAAAPLTFWDAWIKVKELRKFTTRNGQPRMGLDAAGLEKAKQLIAQYT